MGHGDGLPGGAQAVEGAGRDASRFVVDARHLSALLTHVGAVVLTFDDRGVITFVSDQVRELLGLEPAELVGRCAFDYVHPADAERLVGNLARWVGREGITRDDDVRVRTGAGGWRTVSFETVTGDRARPFGAGVATLHAVRSSTAVEQELRSRLASEDRLTRLVRTFMSDRDDFDTCVRRGLEVIGSLEGVDSAGIWHLDEGLLHHRAQWNAPSVEPTIGRYEPFRPEDLPFTRALSRLEEFALRGSDEDPAWAVERQEMARNGGRSYLAVPMVADGAFSGFVAFASHHSEDIFAPTHRATLRTAAGIFAEAFARHRAQEQLRYQAHHDSLTGLANRWAFAAAVDDALADAARRAAPGLAVLLFDIDRFHVINDSLGHPAGDALLRAVAGRLADVTAPGDLLARLGGDELVVLLTDVRSSDDAQVRADRFLAALVEPFSVGPSRLRVSASVGVSFAGAADVRRTDRSTLLREADAAMYAAKRAGGARAVVFDGALRARVMTRLRRERELHGVVERGELCLHYQPELDLRTRSIPAVEALLRWDHPDDGLLVAGDFVDVAEESGLIAEIGAWVLEEALAQLRRWDAAGLPSVTMRINLSARQIADDAVVDHAVDCAGRVGVPPARVCFELTETAVMFDPDRAGAVLSRLRRAGFALAIDDFGTGYSSLAYLRDLPVDLLKIDRSFVASLAGEGAETSLVRAIIQLAEAMDLPVTAEGIETPEQLDALVRLGCRHGQGFLLARPAPPDEVASLLAVTPGP